MSCDEKIVIRICLAHNSFWTFHFSSHKKFSLQLTWYQIVYKCFPFSFLCRFSIDLFILLDVSYIINKFVVTHIADEPTALLVVCLAIK